MAGEVLLYLASCFTGAADTSGSTPPPKVVEPVITPPLPKSDFKALRTPSPITDDIRKLVKDNPEAYRGLFSHWDRILFQVGKKEIPSYHDGALRVAGRNYESLLTLTQRGLQTLYPDIVFSSYGSYGPQTATAVTTFQRDAKLEKSPKGQVDRATLATLMIHLDHPKKEMIDELNDLRDKMVERRENPFFLDKADEDQARQIVRATQMAYPDQTKPHHRIVDNTIKNTGLVDITYTVLREKMGQPDLTLIGPEVLAHLIQTLGGEPNEVAVVRK